MVSKRVVRILLDRFLVLTCECNVRHNFFQRKLIRKDYFFSSAVNVESG